HARNVSKEAGEQCGTHDGVKALASEQVRSHSDSESTGTEPGESHHVEGLPDAPGVGVVHTTDRAESGQFAIGYETERQQEQSDQYIECARAERHIEYGYVSLPE